MTLQDEQLEAWVCMRTIMDTLNVKTPQEALELVQEMKEEVAKRYIVAEDLKCKCFTIHPDYCPVHAA